VEKRRGSLRGDRAPESEDVERGGKTRAAQREWLESLPATSAAIARHHGSAYAAVLIESHTNVREVGGGGQLGEVDELYGPVVGHDDLVGVRVAVGHGQHVRRCSDGDEQYAGEAAACWMVCQESWVMAPVVDTTRRSSSA
jgi:hypothetical protein